MTLAPLTKIERRDLVRRVQSGRIPLQRFIMLLPYWDNDAINAITEQMKTNWLGTLCVELELQADILKHPAGFRVAAISALRQWINKRRATFPKDLVWGQCDFTLAGYTITLESSTP